MPKFKDYDRMFTKRQIEVERQTWLRGFDTSPIMTKWPHKVEQWSQDKVQYAVYEAHDHFDWQRFRVSLKGLTTHEKLYCLDKYLSNVNFDTSGSDLKQARLEKCRIDNYIGALVRGGQLNKNLEVIK